MNRALFAGLAGTIAHQQRLDILGNNLVNANTVGYKQARTTFQDTFYQTLQAASAGETGGVGGQNPVQVGSGVSMGSVQVLMGQGALERTGQPLDVAIDGQGMFVLSDGAQKFFTRDGAFTLDNNNQLVSANTGLKVQGWMADANGVVNTNEAAGEVTFALGELRPPQATGEATVIGNLDAGTATAGAATASILAYDSLGITHDVTITFTKTVNDNEWTCKVECESQTEEDTITFDANGAITGTDSVTLSLDLSAINAAVTPQDITVDLSSLTQLAQTSTPVVRSQDGYAPASLVQVSLAAEGVLQGQYSDGQTMTLGQIAVARFDNAQGLTRTGQSLFVESANSGVPGIGAANSGGRGAVVPGALELSNVDLTASFVDMISTQRGFQASAEVISAADKILEILMRINR